MKLFGREPTLWLQLLSALLALSVTFGWDWLTDENAGAIVAASTALIGAVNAWAVRPIAPAAFTAVVTTVATLAATYGFELTAVQIGATQAIVTAALTLLTRGQVSPKADPLLR
ncbi:hypothetical protein Val02_82190 [Virgisporangium aliadipatigenens]|uniref:Holin n=1 Tax=Virgisporangium aliadipatigenens TaxID=741659 RepID=A0A8J3YVK9_9ACTN|nr:hypothetical protein [Virgisporangium aliadipatigenens]GIJ51333.1 hypothetical protein Val02_82190 [Virgisporangium aliadipatigenens]